MKKEKADNYIEKKYNKVKSCEKITTWFIGFRLDWGGGKGQIAESRSWWRKHAIYILTDESTHV